MASTSSQSSLRVMNFITTVFFVFVVKKIAARLTAMRVEKETQDSDDKIEESHYKVTYSIFE